MKSITAVIKPPFIKLDSLLKLSGICMSGGDAKEAILSGGILVDGERCTARGRKIYPKMVVSAFGEVQIRVLFEGDAGEYTAGEFFEDEAPGGGA